MNPPNQDPNNKEKAFKLSKLLTVKRNPPPRVLPNLTAPAAQIQTTKTNEQAQRARSEDIKPKLVPNAQRAVVRDQSYEAPKKDDAMELEADESKKKPVISKKNLLLDKKDKGPVTTNTRDFSKTKVSLSSERVAFGGGGKSGATISNYDKAPKMKADLFGTNLASVDIYKGKKFLFPIEVKDKEAEPSLEVKPEDVEKKAKGVDQAQGLTETLLNEFCFFQLPANLPLEGCFELTPKTEDPDIEINTDDLLSSFLNNKFDSTGFYLERDFKFFAGKRGEKMLEEKVDTKKGKDTGTKDKDKTTTDNKLYDTFRIGKLCRMKNGDLKIKIGNNFFDVTEGVQDSFYKELFAIDYNEKVAMSLFPIEKKFVIKPDMETFQ